MRENRPSGLEGGAGFIPRSYPYHAHNMRPAGSLTVIHGNLVAILHVGGTHDCFFQGMELADDANVSGYSPGFRRQGRNRVFLCSGTKPHTTAAFTQWIGGSASNKQSHFSPPSRPIQSCPVVVPK